MSSRYSWGCVFTNEQVAVLIGQKPCAVTLALLGVRPVILSSKQSGKLDLGAFLSQAFSIKGKGRWVVSSQLIWEVLQSEYFSSYMSGTFFPIGYSSLRLQPPWQVAKKGLVGFRHQISDLEPHATYWNFEVLFIKGRKNEIRMWKLWLDRVPITMQILAVMQWRILQMTLKMFFDLFKW